MTYSDVDRPTVTVITTEMAAYRAGYAAANARAERLAGLLARWLEWLKDDRYLTKGSVPPSLPPDTAAALAGRAVAGA